MWKGLKGCYLPLKNFSLVWFYFIPNFICLVTTNFVILETWWYTTFLINDSTSHSSLNEFLYSKYSYTNSRDEYLLIQKWFLPMHEHSCWPCNCSMVHTIIMIDFSYGMWRWYNIFYHQTLRSIEKIPLFPKYRIILNVQWMFVGDLKLIMMLTGML